MVNSLSFILSSAYLFSVVSSLFSNCLMVFFILNTFFLLLYDCIPAFKLLVHIMSCCIHFFSNASEITITYFIIATRLECGSGFFNWCEML